jgi:hypothetical protein
LKKAAAHAEPLILRDLRAAGVRVGFKRVARLMKTPGCRA